MNIKDFIKHFTSIIDKFNDKITYRGWVGDNDNEIISLYLPKSEGYNVVSSWSNGYRNFIFNKKTFL